MLFILNAAPVVCVACLTDIDGDGWVSGLASTSGVLGISNIVQSFEHCKLSSISQLTKGRIRDL